MLMIKESKSDIEIRGEHLIELNPLPKPRSAFLWRFWLQRGILHPRIRPVQRLVSFWIT
jgi:hypothetical protein